MRLKKVIFHNFKSLKNAILNLEDKLLTLVGENESGKTNALQGIAKINLDNDLSWHETTYFTEDYQKEIPPKLIFEFRCTDDEQKILNKIYNKSPKIITIERSSRTKSNKFILIKPPITYFLIAKDNFESIISIFHTFLNEYLEYLNTVSNIESEGESSTAYSGETCHPFRPKVGHLNDITNPLTS